MKAKRVRVCVCRHEMEECLSTERNVTLCAIAVRCTFATKETLSLSKTVES